MVSVVVVGAVVSVVVVMGVVVVVVSVVVVLDVVIDMVVWVVGYGRSSCGNCCGGGFMTGHQKSTHLESVRQFNLGVSRVGLFRNRIRSDATKLSLPSSGH